MREKKREIEGEIAWKKKKIRNTRNKKLNTVTKDRGSNKVITTYLLEY